MSVDPIDRLRAANPVPSCPAPPIDEVWHRIRVDNQPPQERTRPRRPLHVRSAMRWVPGVLAALVSAFVGIGTLVLLDRQERHGSATSGTSSQTQTVRTSGHYPSSVYKPPVEPRHNWGSAGKCANIDGVTTPGSNAGKHVVNALTSIDGDLAHDRHYVDRAYWPVLATSDQSYTALRTSGTLSVHPAAQSSYAGLVRSNCGAAIVRRSVEVVYTPGSAGSTSESAIAGHFWFIDRHGHWLLWFTN